MAQGLLFVLSQPRRGDEPEFHDWYDHEHGPARVALPEVGAGHRYRAVDDATPAWLACYDLDLDVLATPAYRRLRERRSPRETAVMARLETLERRVYTLLDEHGAPDGPPGVLLARSVTVAPGHEAELHAWYTEEHIPLLRELPGWHRTRRYVLRDGDAPRFLALHEISGADLFGTDAYRRATSTPWRAAVMRHVTRSERRVFTFHTAFAPPAPAR